MKKREEIIEEQLRSVKFKPNIVIGQADLDASFEKIRERIENSPIIEIKANKHKGFFSSRFLRYAASIAIILTVGIFGVKYYIDNQQLVFANASNEVKSLTMPDGSIIWLRTSSAITYHRNFKTNRNVELNGEALFEVTKDKKHPFSVNTKLGKITVLGTIFSVRANDNENYTKTLLKEGSIRFTDNADKNEVVLVPGEEAIRQQGSNKAEIRKVKNVDRQLAWQSHKYSFENESLSEILAVVGNAFNQKITINDKMLAKQRFTLKFNQNEPLTKILDVLSDVAKFKYKQDNETYIIEKQ